MVQINARQQQFPSLRRIAEACRPDGDGAARVVDAGCGTGALVSFLKEAGVKEGEVTGVDLSPEVCFYPSCYFGSTPSMLGKNIALCKVFSCP